MHNAVIIAIPYIVVPCRKWTRLQQVARSWPDDSDQPMQPASASIGAAESDALPALHQSAMPPELEDADIPALHANSLSAAEPVHGGEPSVLVSHAVPPGDKQSQRQSSKQPRGHVQTQPTQKQQARQLKHSQQSQDQPPEPVLRPQPTREVQPSRVVHMDANPLLSELFATDMEGLTSEGLISSGVVSFHLGLCQLEAMQHPKDAPEAWVFLHPSFFTELKQ